MSAEPSAATMAATSSSPPPPAPPPPPLPPPSSSSSSTAMATAPHALTMEELENTVRNGKKKLYWSAFEVVLATTLPSGAPQETRYDAYQVNHNHLKKIHAGARGASFVRVECKYCTAPRFTQSITVSTKKFEEHYMTLHALDALASADAKKAQRLKNRASGRAGSHSDEEDVDEEEDEHDDDDDDDGVRGEDDGEGAEEGATRGKRTRAASSKSVKRRRRGALTKDDDDHVAAMQGAAAAVVALSGGGNSSRKQERVGGGNPTASATALPLGNVGGSQLHVPPHQPPVLSASLVDSSVVLDPADSDTKRAKKSYWTAYEVVISERVHRGTGSGDDMEAMASDLPTSEVLMRETRQDAWRVNHNALRRLHLDPENDTTVRVECRFCEDPKFNQSITVSTRKFEQHYYYEHGDESQRQALEEKLAARLAEAAATGSSATDAGGVSSVEATVLLPPKRRKSWKALLMDRENSAARKADAGGAKLPAAASLAHPVGGARAVAVRHQRALLLNWLLHDCVPLSTVDSDHFGAFAAALDRKFEPTSSHALHTQLSHRFGTAVGEMKTRLQQEQDGARTVWLTVDDFAVLHAAAAAQTFLSVSVHFVTREWQRQTLLVACRAVPSPATPDRVRDSLRSVLGEYGVPVTAVVGATTRDAGAIADAVTSLASATAAKKKKKPAAAVVLHCAADALQAIARAGCDALLRPADAGALDALWTLAGVDTASGNWMDVYASLSAAIQSHELAVAVAVDASGSTAVLRAEDLAAAQAIVAVLEPFVRVAEDMGAASFPTIPMVFQYFRHLKQTLVLAATASDAAARPLVAAMKDAMDELYDRVVSVDALAAYALDPRFRFAQLSPVDEKRVRAKIEAAAAAVLGKDDADDANGDASSAAASSALGARQTRSLFEELATSGKRASLGGSGGAASASASAQASSAASLVGSSAASDELEAYLALDDEDFGVDVLAWWQTHEPQLPTLAQVARQSLALVGTCLPAQEAFTPEGQRLARHRSVLDADSLEATVVTRAFRESPATPVVASRRRKTTPASSEAPSPTPLDAAGDKSDLAFVV